jgi:intein-encoded DNA endonuclease-like protein
MSHTLEEIIAFKDSLPSEVSALLTCENREKLDQFRIDSEPNDYIYEFPNGYRVEMFRPFSSKGWTVELYAIEDGKLISELHDLMQIQGILECFDIMKLPTYVEPNPSERIIASIRAKCLNADDLAKIASAIEAMREELM